VLHVLAKLGWHFAHLDEVRAFLNVKHKGKNRVFTKLKGDRKFFEVKGALYGLKTSPKEYQEEVARRLERLGYTRLVMCSCMYIMQKDNNIVILYDFVDDFLLASNNLEFLWERINELRGTTTFTEPIIDPSIVLGMELSRDYSRSIICVRMTKKIEEVFAKYCVPSSRKVSIPMPTSGYIIKDDQYEQLPEAKSRLLDKKGIHDYMSIVGSLIWIAGVRMDIMFTVMYLSWATKSPRQHHMDMAKYCLQYLYQSKELPLVLAGSGEVKVTAFTDASVGTAAKGRSVVGHLIKLGGDAGAIYSRSTATAGVHLSSFEAELDGVSSALKTVSRLTNILTELQQHFAAKAVLYSDNKAMIEFIKGEGVAKGVRHMELRMWFIREKYQQGGVDIEYMEGVKLPADKLTKLGNKKSHAEFRAHILGLKLLADKNKEEDDEDIGEDDEGLVSDGTEGDREV
jgi:hypothetical protein